MKRNLKFKIFIIFIIAFIELLNINKKTLANYDNNNLKLSNIENNYNEVLKISENGQMDSNADVNCIYTYNEDTNAVTLNVSSNIKMTNSKVTPESGWTLSADGLTYTKKYIQNTKYFTTFNFENGESQEIYIVISQIKKELIPTVEYDKETNSATLKVTSNVKMTNSKVISETGWSLSTDGLVYIKKFTQNINFNTTFSFIDGTTQKLYIDVDKIITPILKQTTTYDSTNNKVNVNISSNVKMTNSKVSATSGWTLSADGLTYTKEYTANTNYNTNFTFVDGTTQTYNIIVTEIFLQKLRQSTIYNENTNSVTVRIISNVKMTNSKVSAASGWTLSVDGLTYSKEYTANTNYNTTFIFTNGTTQTYNIIVIQILKPTLTQVVKYNDTTKISTLVVTSNVKMTNSKVSSTSGWTLSADGLRYSKEYTANTNYNTTFTFADGTNQTLNIIITQIFPKLTQTTIYNATLDSVIVKITSNVAMTNSKVTSESGWTLSADGLTYSKMYYQNINENSTFSFIDGRSEIFNILVDQF